MEIYTTKITLIREPKNKSLAEFPKDGNLYLAYGSNLNKAQMQDRMGGTLPEVVRRVRIIDRELTYGKSRSDGTGKATLRKDAIGKTAVAVLYKITREQLGTLDGYEGISVGPMHGVAIP